MSVGDYDRCNYCHCIITNDVQACETYGTLNPIWAATDLRIAGLEREIERLLGVLVEIVNLTSPIDTPPASPRVIRATAINAIFPPAEKEVK